MLRITLSTRQYLFFFVWTIIFLMSLFLLLASMHIIPSLILFIINLLICIYGFVYTAKTKNILFFSPIFQTAYCALFYCGLIGLFYFSKYNFIDFFQLPTKNEALFVNISLIYLIFICSIFLPYFLSLFFKKKIKLNFAFLQSNFSTNKVKVFLLYSQIFLIFLLCMMFITTKYNPITAILNPLGFRFEYNHGLANYFYSVFAFMIKFHLCLILNYIFIDNESSINKKFYIIPFFIFYFFWAAISGARGWFIWLFLLCIYFFSFSKKYKINLKNILMFFSLGLITITMSSAYYVFRNYQADVQSGKIKKTTEVNVIYSSLERIDNFSNSVRFFMYVDNHKDGIWEYSDFNYKKQFVSQITNFIPRSLLKDKGYPISGELTRIIFPHVFGKINLIFGGIVNLFYTGGVVFVIIDALLFGTVIMLIHVNFRKLMKYDSFFVNYILIFLNIPIAYFSQGFYNSSTMATLISEVIVSSVFTYLLMKSKNLS